MIPSFAFLPPETNSLLMFAGAGSTPLLTAALAWEGLSADLARAASSFGSIISGLADGVWTGPAALSMAAAAAPYILWLNSAAEQAAAAGTQARVATTAFETARAATVPTAEVMANRARLTALIATNVLAQNTPAIAMTELEYLEMWLKNVAAMTGYHVGAVAVASVLPSFSIPPLSLPGLGGVAASAASPLTGLATGLASEAQAALSAVPSALSSVASPLSSVAEVGLMPVSMLMSPMIGLAQSANGASLASSTTGLAGEAPKFVGNAVPDAAKGMGGAGGLGNIGANLGQARLVGAMSVPPTWQGSVPGKMISEAMSGLGAMPNAASTSPNPAGGGMPMMPMPMGGGAGSGMPGGALGRGGASPHVVQKRPGVVPRTGIV